MVQFCFVVRFCKNGPPAGDTFEGYGTTEDGG